MKRFKKILFLALMVAALSCLFCQPAFAISEEEVQAQVDAVGKEAVSGNVLIWFMCAIGFLKVSQKIDSFMASLGVNAVSYTHLDVYKRQAWNSSGWRNTSTPIAA